MLRRGTFRPKFETIKSLISRRPVQNEGGVASSEASWREHFTEEFKVKRPTVPRRGRRPKPLWAPMRAEYNSADFN